MAPDNSQTKWYIPGEGRQPAGPFTVEHIIHAWRSGGVSPDSMCWCEGMSQWLPLSQVEPFASVFRQSRPFDQPANKPSKEAVEPASKTRKTTLIMVAGIICVCVLSIVFGIWIFSRGGEQKIVGRWERIDVSNTSERSEFLKDGSATFYKGSMALQGKWRFLPDGRLETRANLLGIEKAQLHTVKFDGDTIVLTSEDGTIEQHKRVAAFSPVEGNASSLIEDVKAARTQVRSQISINNMKMIGLAMQSYHDAHGAFPPAYTTDGNGKPLLSWRVLILPYLDQTALYEQFHLNEPWNSDHNMRVVARMPQEYKPPRNEALAHGGKTAYKTVRGEMTIFPGRKGVARDEITSGTSNTIMVVEVPDDRAVVWTEPADYEFNEQDPAAGLIGPKDDGFLAVLGDGSVRSFPWSIKETALKALFNRNGAESTEPSKSRPSSDTAPLAEKHTSSPKSHKRDDSTITEKQPPSQTKESSPVSSLELAAPALKSGLLINNNLSVAVAAFRRHVPGAQTGFFSTEATGLAITLAFRRVGAGFTDPRLEVIATDDRGNEYRSLYRLPRSRVLNSGRIPAASELRGAPACLDQMPVGFTWTSELVVQMPPAAPVAKVELEYALSSEIGNRQRQRVPLNIADPAMPDFAFAVPPKLALDEGSTIEAGKDIQGKIGRLTVDNSFISKGASGFDTPKTVKGLALTLPVELTNQDYNKREAVVPRLAIQFADGETIETSGDDMLQSAEVKDDPKFLNGLPVIDVPGGSSRTLLLHVNVAADMKRKAGLKLNGLLLYVKDIFCGFVRIPEDANAAIARIGVSETRPESSAPEDATSSDDDQPSSQNPLSGRWRASAGATFRLKDDGETVTVELIQGRPLTAFSGELSRGDNGSDSKTLTGTITATFMPDTSKQYSMRVKITIDDPDHLQIRCTDWPMINNAGRSIGKKTLNESWTRVGSGSSQQSKRNQPLAPQPPASRHR